MSSTTIASSTPTPTSAFSNSPLDATTPTPLYATQAPSNDRQQQQSQSSAIPLYSVAILSAVGGAILVLVLGLSICVFCCNVTTRRRPETLRKKGSIRSIGVGSESAFSLSGVIGGGTLSSIVAGVHRNTSTGWRSQRSSKIAPSRSYRKSAASTDLQGEGSVKFSFDLRRDIIRTGTVSSLSSSSSSSSKRSSEGAPSGGVVLLASSRPLSRPHVEDAATALAGTGAGAGEVKRSNSNKSTASAATSETTMARESAIQELKSVLIQSLSLGRISRSSGNTSGSSGMTWSSAYPLSMKRNPSTSGTGPRALTMPQPPPPLHQTQAPETALYQDIGRLPPIPLRNSGGIGAAQSLLHNIMSIPATRQRQSVRESRDRVSRSWSVGTTISTVEPPLIDLASQTSTSTTSKITIQQTPPTPTTDMVSMQMMPPAYPNDGSASGVASAYPNAYPGSTYDPGLPPLPPKQLGTETPSPKASVSAIRTAKRTSYNRRRSLLALTQHARGGSISKEDAELIAQLYRDSLHNDANGGTAYGSSVSSPLTASPSSQRKGGLAEGSSGTQGGEGGLSPASSPYPGTGTNTNSSNSPTSPFWAIGQHLLPSIPLASLGLVSFLSGSSSQPPQQRGSGDVLLNGSKSLSIADCSAVVARSAGEGLVDQGTSFTPSTSLTQQQQTLPPLPPTTTSTSSSQPRKRLRLKPFNKPPPLSLGGLLPPGGVKNCLTGTVTVANANPPSPAIPSFPCTPVSASPQQQPPFLPLASSSPSPSVGSPSASVK
ncbi:hypothetical protein HK102_013314 [Quaeritorhiza haematococci]|nr:hypothetical protein HK102_013314 [Quaeritorhiza haematococci]